MKLTSLKQKWSDVAEPSKSDDVYYPSLYLDEKQLEAMAVDTAKVGTDLTMIATVRVSSLSESKNGPRSMSFEIIEAAMKPKEEGPDAASVLFPDEK